MSDWRQNIMDKVAEREARLKSPRGHANITYPMVDHAVLKAAADARGMGVGTYARAAMYAMACYDLGLDVDEMLSFLPQYSRETGKLVGGATTRTDSKPTNGQWGITGLTGRDHGRAEQ